MNGFQLIPIGALRRALVTLDDGQGRIARRNARKRVAAALRSIHDQMDLAFPAIAAPKKQAKPRRTPEEIRRDLIADGWVVITNNSPLFPVVAELRLPTRITVAKVVSVQPVAPYQKIPKPSALTWIPGWVAHYYPNKQALTQARKNSKMIVAAKAAIRLGSLQELVLKGAIQCPTK